MSFTSATTDRAASKQPVDTTGETTRANLFLVLSRAFASPLQMSELDPDRMRQVAVSMPESLATAVRDLADSWDDAMAQQQDLSLSYARLFLGPFNILAPPYASFYLEPDQRLMGPVSQFVATVYAEAGLEPGPGPREAPDHVSLEWEYLYFVTHRYLDSGDVRWLDRRSTFVETHVSRWMPSLADAMKNAGGHAFYNKLSVLIANLFKDQLLE